MEPVTEFCRDNPTLTTVVGGLVVATAGIIAYRAISKRSAQVRSEKKYPKDTVILHQIGRGPYAPSLTPFAVKLETYLRMAKIPYKNVHSMDRSSKGKFPWIEYNGQSIADSAFCIMFLNKARNINMNSRFKPEQRAAAVAFQRLAEDSLYWVLVLQRWVHEMDLNFLKIAFSGTGPAFSLIFRFRIKPNVEKMAWGQGMGRHSKEEVIEIGRKDLKAISDFLGQKLFLLGDEPCEEDCAVFGQLSQFYWHLPTQTVGRIFKEEFPNLVRYCDRMKSMFWPDWDDCITHGGKRLANK